MATFRLWIGSIPHQAQADDIHNLFYDSGLSLSKLDVSIDPFTGRNPGYIFVDLPDREAYDTAMQYLPGQTVRGRAIKVNAASSPNPRKSGTEARIRSYGRDGARSIGGVQAGISDSGPADYQRGSFAFNRWSRGQNEASERRGTPVEQRRLYVGGLPRIEPQSAAQELIGRIFRSYEVEAISKVISPDESIRNRTGNGYYAFVDLPTEVEAKAAIRALDGLQTDDGFLKVSMAKSGPITKVIREQLSNQPADGLTEAS